VNKTNIINKKQFLKMLEIVSKGSEISNVDREEHPELIDILKTILFTQCDINLDYADLIGFVKNSNLVQYGIVGHKGSKAMFFAMESIMQSILNMDDKIMALVVHMKLPEQFSLDTLEEMNEKLEFLMEDDGDLLFQFDISSDLKPDEVWIYILYGVKVME